MSDHATTLRAHATWLRHGVFAAGSAIIEDAALACESGAAALEREAERQRSECSRSTLAPEHAAALRRKAAHGGTPSYLRDAILAALAAIDQRPRLAPEHVEALRRVVSFFASAETFDGATQAEAILAALAALGESPHE